MSHESALYQSGQVREHRLATQPVLSNFLSLLHSGQSLRTRAQLQIRASFGSVSARWRTLTEEQRVRWCIAGKKKTTRRRLGRCWPLPGFNYFVKINVALAFRGQAQTIGVT